MLLKTTSAGIAAAALALTLAGCGGTSTPTSESAPPSSSAPTTSATSAGEPSSAPSSEPSSSAPSSAGTSAAEVKDPCQVLDAGDVEKITGVAVKKGTSSSVSGSSLCTWLPENGTAATSVVFTAQEGPKPGSLSQLEDQLAKQFDGKAESVSVSGADDAVIITGKKSGLNIIDVVATKGDVFYQVLAASPRSVDSHRKGAIELTAALASA